MNRYFLSKSKRNEKEFNLFLKNNYSNNLDTNLLYQQDGKAFNIINNFKTAGFIEPAGGNNKKCGQVFQLLKPDFTNDINPNSAGEDLVITSDYLNLKYNVEKLDNKSLQIDDSKLLVPLHVDRTKYKTHEQLFTAIKEWWVNLKHRDESTINDRIRYAKAMTNHPVYPINWFDFIPEQIINQLQFKQIEEYPSKAEEKGENKATYGICQLHNDWKVVNTFARAFGINISHWGYTPPSRPEPQKKIIPRPHIVHMLMNSKYSKDRFTNVLIKTIITIGFQIGWRPSEASIQKISDIYLDEGYLIIREPKKKHRERQVWIDDRVMNSPRQNSLHNWLNIWRPRYATEESRDLLFIQKNGRPFPTVDAYRMFLNGYCKPIWNDFKPKIMRDWCAIAKLIQSKIETKKWDIRIVKNALGHKSEKTTEIYIKFAEEYYRHDPYNWLTAVLKFHNKIKKHYGAVKQAEQSQKDLKINKQFKSEVCGQNIRRKINAPIGI